MKEAASSRDQIHAISVSPKLRALTLLAAVIPGIASVGVLIQELWHPGSESTIQISVWGICAIFSAWMSARIYSLYSVRVTEKGISQLFYFSGRRLVSRVFASWEEIHSLTHSQLTFVFRSNAGVTFELNLATYSNADEAKRAIVKLLPRRLADVVAGSGTKENALRSWVAFAISLVVGLALMAGLAIWWCRMC